MHLDNGHPRSVLLNVCLRQSSWVLPSVWRFLHTNDVRCTVLRRHLFHDEVMQLRILNLVIYQQSQLNSHHSPIPSGLLLVYNFLKSDINAMEIRRASFGRNCVEFGRTVLRRYIRLITFRISTIKISFGNFKNYL